MPVTLLTIIMLGMLRLVGKKLAVDLNGHILNFTIMDSDQISKSGRKYISDFKSNDLITVVYLSGSGQIGKPLSALRATPFYKLFYAAFKDKYNFFLPMQYAGSSGWEKKIDGLSSGAHFIQEMIDLHGIDKIVATGHSAGGTYATAISLAGKVKGFAPVAGGSLDIVGTKGMSSKGIQLFATHGDADRGGDKGVNGFAYGSKAVRWYTGGGGKPIFNILPGVGHGSDIYAYKPSFGMAEWFDSLFEPVVVPPKPGIYVDGVWAGTDSCTVDNHLITLIK